MRVAEVKRKTAETDITLTLNLDGEGKSEINSGNGFMDHMLTLFAKHARFDIILNCKGDCYVDYHHTAEDIGICLGKAIKEALGEKKGIVRYGSMILPMDESLVMCAIDLSGRPYLVFDGEFNVERVGYFDTEMVKEFFYAISYSAGMNLHIKEMYGSNAHHIIEAMFKGFARALDEAVTIDERVNGLPSTKGAL